MTKQTYKRAVGGIRWSMKKRREIERKLVGEVEAARMSMGMMVMAFAAMGGMAVIAAWLSAG